MIELTSMVGYVLESKGYETAKEGREKAAFVEVSAGCKVLAPLCFKL